MNDAMRLTVLLIASCLVPVVAVADPAFPNLTGTWNAKSEGTAMVHAKESRKANAHRDAGSRTLVAEFQVTKQEGRIVEGTFKSTKATEPFVCAFGHDAKMVYCADTDGYFDLRVIDPDTMEVIYRHATPKHSVVAVGTMKRKK